MLDLDKPCPLCHGRGFVVDDVKMGRMYREARLKKKLSLRYVAKRMSYSASFISDLELGRRKWTLDKMYSFDAILREKK